MNIRTKFYIRSFTDSEIFGGTLKILEAKFLCLIILMAPSVEGLQRLLTVCEDELITLDMKINIKKSVCIRFGARYDYDSANLHLCSGDLLKWTVSCRYLGIYLASARPLKCSFDVARAKFYRAFNSIFGKVGRLANETVILNLLSSKCLPLLLYCTEACPLLSRDLNSMSFAVNRVLNFLFEIVRSC